MSEESEDAEKTIEEYFAKRRNELEKIRPLIPRPIATEIINAILTEDDLIQACFKNALLANKRINEIQKAIGQITDLLEKEIDDVQSLKDLKPNLEELKELRERMPLIDSLLDEIDKRRKDKKKTTPGTW